MGIFETNRACRLNVMKIVDSLSLEQMNTIPTGFNNNVFWNLGHILVTQQLLCYKLANLPLKIDDELVDKFRKGSKPSSNYTQEDLDWIKSNFLALVDQAEKDYNDGIFKEFQEYPTSFGVTLNNSLEALEFNNVHEALHLGVLMALRKLV